MLAFHASIMPGMGCGAPSLPKATPRSRIPSPRLALSFPPPITPPPQTWKRIKEDSDPKCWAIFAVDEAVKNKLVVVSSGRCGLDRMYKHLKDEEVRAAPTFFSLSPPYPPHPCPAQPSPHLFPHPTLFPTPPHPTPPHPSSCLAWYACTPSRVA